MKTSYITIFLVGLIWAQEADRAKIIQYSGAPADALPARWSWALQIAADEQQPFWVGYAFSRQMNENSYIGCFSDGWTGGKTLGQDIQAGFQKAPRLNSHDDRHTELSDSGRLVRKSIAVLCYLDGGRFVRLELNNLSLPFDLDTRNLYWLGSTGDEESISFLEEIFKKYPDNKVGKECIAAIGTHQHQRAFGFLKGIVHNNERIKFRAQAVFWLAQSGFPGVMDELEWAVEHDPALKVRKQAVFGFYLTDNPAGDDALIKLARRHGDLEIRKQAIFWLGQRASQKAVAAIEETVFSEEETELQNHAVFALSQLSDQRGLSGLIKAAKEHPNPAVRKKAIFWLGQMDDDRALQVLVDIIKQ